MLISKFFIILRQYFYEMITPKTEKPLKIKKKYPINMNISGAHFQIVSNKSTHFQKNPCTHFLEHAWTKSWGKDGQINRKTDRVKPIYTPQTSFAWV